MAKINVLDTEITIVNQNDRGYISLTDMANAKEGKSWAADIIKSWIRGRYTLEFLGTWEYIHNPMFKVVKLDHFRMQADPLVDKTKRYCHSANESVHRS